MIDRIRNNEERFDSILLSVKELDKALNNFNSNRKNINLLNRYYGSKNWFKDKELFESGKIKDVKAGVLSEDGVWNMLDDIDNIMLEMKEIIRNYSK